MIPSRIPPPGLTSPQDLHSPQAAGVSQLLAGNPLPQHAYPVSPSVSPSASPDSASFREGGQGSFAENLAADRPPSLRQTAFDSSVDAPPDELGASRAADSMRMSPLQIAASIGKIAFVGAKVATGIVIFPLGIGYAVGACLGAGGFMEGFSWLSTTAGITGSGGAFEHLGKLWLCAVSYIPRSEPVSQQDEEDDVSHTDGGEYDSFAPTPVQNWQNRSADLELSSDSSTTDRPAASTPQVRPPWPTRPLPPAPQRPDV